MSLGVSELLDPVEIVSGSAAGMSNALLSSLYANFKRARDQVCEAYELVQPEQAALSLQQADRALAVLRSELKTRQLLYD